MTWVEKITLMDEGFRPAFPLSFPRRRESTEKITLNLGRVYQNAPHFGLLWEQSLQYPPPSLRDTSAGGGQEAVIASAAKQSRKLLKILDYHND
jgi:hypothetical protein